MDDFREWLSDYLRYFELGGAILLVILILFFGVRACVGGRSSRSDEEEVVQKEETVDITEDTAQQNTDDASQTAVVEELDTAPAEIIELVENYFKALEDQDLTALNALVDELSPSDEARIANSRDYITGYHVGDVYVKEGLDTNSYVVYACCTYTCKDITTPVPSLFRFYVKKNPDGSYIIDGSADSDAQISTYMNSLESDAAVKALAKKVQDDYNSALAGDSALAAFLSGLGEESSSSAANTEDTSKVTMITNDDCNVRDSAAGDVIDGIEAGVEVEILDQDGDWYHVRYNGTEGYIYASLLDPVTR